MNSFISSARFALGLLSLGASAFGQIVNLDTFDLGVSTGSVVAGSSWEGNISFNPTSITVGGSAQNDGGWAVYNGMFDATGMNFLSLTAMLGEGHDDSTLFTIQFDDWNLNTTLLTLDTSVFSHADFSTAYVSLVWSDGFDPSQITGWTIGGGAPTPGFQNYRLTLEDMHLTASPIPEPATYALWMGGAMVLLVLKRRQARSRAVSKAGKAFV